MTHTHDWRERGHESDTLVRFCRDCGAMEHVHDADCDGPEPPVLDRSKPIDETVREAIDWTLDTYGEAIRKLGDGPEPEHAHGDVLVSDDADCPLCAAGMGRT